MASQKSRFLPLMPKSSGGSRLRDATSEKLGSFWFEDDNTNAQARRVSPLALSEQPLITDDEWERWYVSISIGRPATPEDIVAWRVRQANLEIQGQQDATDYSAWMMVKAKLRERERIMTQGARQVNEGLVMQPTGQQHTEGVYHPGLGVYVHPPAGTQTRTDLPDPVPRQTSSGASVSPPKSSYPAWSNSNSGKLQHEAGSSSSSTVRNDYTQAQHDSPVSDPPEIRIALSIDDHVKEKYQEQSTEEVQTNYLRAPEYPIFRRNESLRTTVVKREHARAVSNQNVPVPQASPPAVEPSSPPATAPATVTTFGEDPFAPPPSPPSRPSPPDPNRVRRRFIGGRLAFKVGSYAERADARRRFNEMPAPPSPVKSPNPAFNPQGVKSSMEEILAWNPRNWEPKASETYVPPSKRNEDKPWLCKSWR